MEKITIHIPEGGRVATFTVDTSKYDLKIWEIKKEEIKKSRALREMVSQTGATHQGRISFKNGGRRGNIEELNKIIEMIEKFNKGEGAAFYSIIK